MNSSKNSPIVNNLFEITASAKDLDSFLSTGPDACMQLGKDAIDQGQLSISYDILKASLDRYPGHVGITYLAALALARSGSLDEASETLDLVRLDDAASTAQKIDVLSLAGRIAKDRWAQASSSKMSHAAGEDSISSYLKAFELSRDYFPGINAATMMRLMGKTAASKDLAGQVKKICLAQDTQDHWCMATLGEAFMLTGDTEKALSWYLKASKLAEGRFGDLASMRRQLRLICNYLDLPADILDVIVIPAVAAFLQVPDKNQKSLLSSFDSEFPESLPTEFIEQLSNYQIGFAYSSALCMEEILFIEEMQRQQKETNIYLPFEPEEIINSISGPGGTAWLSRVQAARKRADRAEVTTSEGHFGDDSLYGYTARLIGGNALLRAEHLETDLILLTVPGSEGIDNDLAIAQLKKQARHADIFCPIPANKIEIISPMSYKGTSNTPLVKQKIAPPQIQREVRTMIFSDMVGFSSFTEEATVAYVGFIDVIAGIIKNSPQRPLFQNTWGDGLFLVFESASKAAQFSIELMEKIQATNWAKRGLPDKTNIRIGMHTGPVYPAVDKIIGQNNFFGTHVNKAARVEPIATPGTIYLTEQCAAYIVAEDRSSFSLEYLGPRPLAKGFGSYRLYRLRRRSAIENQNR